MLSQPPYKWMDLANVDAALDTGDSVYFLHLDYVFLCIVIHYQVTMYFLHAYNLATANRILDYHVKPYFGLPLRLLDSFKLKTWKR